MEIPDKWIEGLFHKLDKFEKEHGKNKCATWQEQVAFSSLKGYIESLNSMKWYDVLGTKKDIQGARVEKTTTLEAL